MTSRTDPGRRSSPGPRIPRGSGIGRGRRACAAAGLGVEVGEIGVGRGKLRHPFRMPRPARRRGRTCGLPETCHPERVPFERRADTRRHGHDARSRPHHPHQCCIARRRDDPARAPARRCLTGGASSSWRSQPAPSRLGSAGPWARRRRRAGRRRASPSRGRAFGRSLRAASAAMSHAPTASAAPPSTDHDANAKAGVDRFLGGEAASYPMGNQPLEPRLDGDARSSS